MKSPGFITAAVGIFALFVTGSALRAQSLFDFDDITPGTFTPFSDTEGGITALFSSPSADPGGFTIFSVSNFLVAPPFVGNALYDPGPSGDSSIPLDVSFSSSLTSVTLDFATDGASPFTLDAYAGGIGGTFIGSSTVTGVVPAGYISPQGVISFSSAEPFDTITLGAADVPYFAVDNIDVGSVPEPSTWAMMAAGVGLLCLRRNGVNG